MPKHETDSQRLIASLPSYGTLAGEVLTYLIRNLSPEQIDYYLRNKDKFKTNLAKVFVFTELHYQFMKDRLYWQNFYDKYFGWGVNFSSVIVPPRPDESEAKWKLLFIPKGMTLNSAYDRAANLFSTSCREGYENLCKEVSRNARETINHYSIWVPDGETVINKDSLHCSPSKTDPEMKLGMTLLERILLEIDYFQGTGGDHLDADGKTGYCSGSRDLGGYVPSVYIDKKGVFVISHDQFEGLGYNYGICECISLKK